MSRSHAATQPRSHAGSRAATCTLAFLAALALAGCGESDNLGPPTITYAQTECELCKMIVSEEAFAAAVVIDGPDGVRKLAFDDVGCLLDFLRTQPPQGRVTCYVHDQQSRKWLDATSAVFVRSDALQTPMASHLAACESPAAAEQLQRRYPGTLVTFEQLRTVGQRRLASESAASERSAP